MPNITKVISCSIVLIATLTTAQAQDEATPSLYSQPTTLADGESAWDVLTQVDVEIAGEDSISAMASLISTVATPEQVEDLIAGVDPEEIILSSGWSLGDVLGLKMSTNLFQIRPQHSNKCIDVESSSTAESANVVQNTCVEGKASQLWRAIYISSTTYSIISQNSGRCLDVTRSSTGNGANIIQFSCHFRKNQQWLIGGGHVPGGTTIRAKHSRKCMDVRRSSMEDGANIIQFECHFRLNQRFEVPGF